MTANNKSNQHPTAGNSEFNALSFMIRSAIRGQVSTAIPVIVKAVDADGSEGTAGYVDVLPLVCQTDPDNNTLEPVTLYHLPYSRIQGGVAAVVIDPVVGDIGLAVFAQQDSSNVTSGASAPVQPGSFRCFDMSDGFYIGGFLNQAPTCYMELMQDNTITINATSGITVNGTITVNGDVIADGISLVEHTHPGCQGGSTGSAQ